MKYLVFAIFGFSLLARSYDVGFQAPNVDGAENISSPQKGAIVFDSDQGTFFGNRGTNANPDWVQIGGSSSVVQNYAFGTFDRYNEWQMVGTNVFWPFTSIASGSFVVTSSSGLAVTAAASNGMGITFTPSSVQALYRVTFRSACKTTDGNFHDAAFRLYDNGNNIQIDQNESANSVYSLVLSGLYAPATSSAVTVLVQAATPYYSGGGWGSGYVLECGGAALGPSNSTWSVQQIR